MAENVIIKELLYKPFSVPLLRDKLRIVSKIRPTPPLPNLITHHRTKTQGHSRDFGISKVWRRLQDVKQQTNFTVGPIYIFLTSMKYGTNRTSRIWIIYKVPRKNTQNHKHCYLELSYLGNNRWLTCSSPLNAERTPSGKMDNWRRAEKYYFGLSILCVALLISNFRSEEVMSSPHL